MNPRTELITQLTNEIAVRQDVINALHKLDERPANRAGSPLPAARPTMPSEKPPRRAKPQAHQRLNLTSGLAQRPGGPSTRQAPKTVSSAPAGSILTPLDKPTTIGGAMKLLIRALSGHFVPSRLWNELQTQYPDLCEAEDARTRFNGNLSNWVYTGKLVKEGGGETLDGACKWTDVGKEWFGA